MSLARIEVELPKARTKLGVLSLIGPADAVSVGPAEAYGKADNRGARDHGNPTRDPLLPFGDTPLGEYECHVAKAKPLTPSNLRKYGPQGYIVLDPTAGDALTSKKNGRTGLLIHGGDLNSAGRLRPTYGCVRLSNTDMESLIAALNALAMQQRDPLRCVIREA